MKRQERRGLRRRGLLGLGSVGLALVLAMGCAPRQDELGRVFAIRRTVDPDYRSALAVLERHRNSPGAQNEYAVFGMSATAVSVSAGDYRDADRIGKDTYQVVKKYQDATTETLAAWGKESIKFFKGEPHERSMLAWYLGLVAYQRGEFNDARIFFMQSLLAAATRDEDAGEFRDDFRLGHYWLGRAYQHLEQIENARIAYDRAGRVLAHKGQEGDLARLKRLREAEYRRELEREAESYRQATRGEQPVAGAVDLSAAGTRRDLPERLSGATAENPVLASAGDLSTFLDAGFQRDVNLIIVVEVGIGPLKYLAGFQGERDEIAPGVYKERFVDVYIDGHRVGLAQPLCDMYHQACTRGVKTRRGRQTGKMIAKEVLRRVPIAGGLFSYWNVSADARHVPVLPGEVHVFAARVKPGLHTVGLRCSDINQNYLPRYDVERRFIPVGEDRETVLVLQTQEDQDNAHLLDQARAGPAGK